MNNEKIFHPTPTESQMLNNTFYEIEKKKIFFVFAEQM